MKRPLRIACAVVCAAVAHLAAAGPAAAVDPVVTRGPYLQRASSTGIVVRWRTSTASTARVRYGTTVGALSDSVDSVALTSDHEIAIAGLQPDTRYYYEVGTMEADLEGDDPDHTFVTPPPPGTAKPTRLWVLGDSGTGSPSAMAVRDAYADYGEGRDTDLWLMLGDNAYNSGTDSEYQAGVFEIYPSMLKRSALWPTRGNHDFLYAGPSNDYYDIFTLPTLGESGGLPSGTEAYYSFDHGAIHFICLDSEGTPRTPGSPMLTWLTDDLAATDADWIIAFWHHPPYTKGSHDSDINGDSGGRMRDMRAFVLPILEAGGVDLVLTGHSHSYERTCLLDGHYGPSATLVSTMKLDPGDGRASGDGEYHKPTLQQAPHEGAVYVVAGSSGQTGGGALNHPAMIVSMNLLGSMVIDVDSSRLEARFLGSDGTVRDEFAMVKGVPSTVPPPPPPAPAGPIAIEPAWPNPTTGPASIDYSIPESGHVQVLVIDALGRRVVTLVDDDKDAGRHRTFWDGRTLSGGRAPSGIYYLVMESAKGTWARKLSLR
jgi:hypothetical protein